VFLTRLQPFFQAFYFFPQLGAVLAHKKHNSLSNAMVIPSKLPATDTLGTAIATVKL
jgi:hypothetical protein